MTVKAAVGMTVQYFGPPAHERGGTRLHAAVIAGVTQDENEALHLIVFAWKPEALWSVAAVPHRGVWERLIAEKPELERELGCWDWPLPPEAR